MGVDLFDSLTRAAKQMSACCVKTMNQAIDVHPEKRKPLATSTEGGAIVLTFACATCGKATVIRASRGSVKVDTTAGPGPVPPAQSAH